MPGGLGGRPRPYNPLDYHVSSLGKATPEVHPDTFSSLVPIIYMQGTYGTCGAHAGAQLANILFNTITSPKFLWKIIASIDHIAITDGTDMTSIFKALQTVGACDLALLDNSSEDSLQAYSDIKEITPAMMSNAASKRIGTYAFSDNPTLDEVKQAIFDHKVALLLVDCGDGWWLPSWADSNVNPLHIGNFVGHHFVVATQYGATLIDGPNSWSTDWGNAGMYDFDISYIPHVLEMGVATLPTDPANSTIPTYKFNNNLYFGLLSNPDVHALQTRLNVTPATGNFGPLTFAAVRTYQSAHNIMSTGFVGVLTRASLNGS